MSKKQQMLFGVIMPYAMTYGMEVYNVAIKAEINLGEAPVWQILAIWLGTVIKIF